ncbi:MAG: CBS domain-containing protein [Deltaproteobacteria bacterium]|nr:MAG: CBS domain-containing protein [Deltaproteobacteria bacterium]
MIVGRRMKKNPVCVDEEDSMKKAMDLLKEKGIRHLPVLRGGEKLVGIVSDRDIKAASPSPATSLEIREIYYLLDKIKVKQIMTKKPYTVSPSTPIEEAALIMREKKIGALPVVEKGKLVGIITETDILDAFLDAMGVAGPGYRIEIELPNKPGQLFEVAKLLKEFEVNIVSVVTASSDDPEKKILVFRIETNRYKVVKSMLKKSGFSIIAAD